MQHVSAAAVSQCKIGTRGLNRLSSQCEQTILPAIANCDFYTLGPHQVMDSRNEHMAQEHRTIGWLMASRLGSAGEWRQEGEAQEACRWCQVTGQLACCKEEAWAAGGDSSSGWQSCQRARCIADAAGAEGRLVTSLRAQIHPSPTIGS